jgi:hypothetical protein
VLRRDKLGLVTTLLFRSICTLLFLAIAMLASRLLRLFTRSSISAAFLPANPASFMRAKMTESAPFVMTQIRLFGKRTITDMRLR